MSASEHDSSSSAPAPDKGAGKSASPSSARPARRGIGLAGLAVVLALVALLLAGYGSWRAWLQHQGGERDNRILTSLQQRVDAMRAGIDAQQSGMQSLQQQVQIAQQQSQSLGVQVQGLSDRSRSLENAVAGLTAREQSGRDTVRLDEAGMLLQMAGERYALFHDTEGTLRALQQADHVLAQVEDPAYAAVRQTLAEERKALAATHPEQRRQDLDALSHMRAESASLPLRPAASLPATPGHGFWGRVRQAFSGLVQVQREDAYTPARRALARDLLTLDLAQAQSALLAWDGPGYRQALDRAQTRLERAFDPEDPAVRRMRAQLDRMRKQPTPPAPQLGAAWTQLHNLRVIHEASGPATPATTSTPEGGRP